MKLSLWERVCSQLWSSKTFFQHGFVREIARTTSRRDREKYERRLNESDVTDVRLTMWRQSAYAQDLGAFTVARKYLIRMWTHKVCTNAHNMIWMLCVLTKMCEAFLHMIVCKHSIYRVRKWTDQIELNYKFCFCFFYKNIIFSEFKSVCP